MKYKPVRYRDDLTEARERAGLTQRQAAAAVGVSMRSWQRYEYGDRTPSRTHRWAIQRLLGITAESWGEPGRGWRGARG
jgi:transcriptional regulator with XRE-family HTH domain